MVDEESKLDVAKEARELLRNKPAPLFVVPHPNWKNAYVRLSHNPEAQWTDFGYVATVINEYAQLFARAPGLLSSLCDEVEQLRSLNQTQAESIAEFQREQREFRRALVETAIPYEALLTDAQSRKWIAPEVWASVEQAVKAARSAITPKGSPELAQREGEKS